MLWLFSLSLFILSSNCGLINFYSLDVVPANILLPQSITLKYSLSNPTTSSDYLLLVWPYSLSSSTTFTGTWSQYTSCSSVQTDASMVLQFTFYQTANSLYYYFVQFYKSGSVVGLSSGVIYTLSFSSIAPSVAAGYQLGVQLYTVSAANTFDFIVYDSNEAFASFYLGNAPGNSLGITLTFPATTVDIYAAKSSYTVYFQITPVTKIDLHSEIEIALDDDAYGFLANSCENIVQTGDQPLTISSIVYQKNKVIIKQNANLLATSPFTISCDVQNPSYPSVSTVTVSTAYYNYPILVEQATTLTTSTNVLVVAPFLWDKSLIKILVGWGVDITQYGINEAFRLYKDPNSNELWYNGIKVNFIPPADIDICTTITVSTVNVTTGILKNTIHHTFPPCGKYMPSYTISSSQEIIFTNVGPIKKSEDYYVAFKINLPFATSALVALGAIQINSLSGFAIINRLTDAALLINDPLIKNVITTNRVLKSIYIPTDSQVYHDGYDSLIPNSPLMTMYLTHETDGTIIDSASVLNGFEYYTTYNLQVDWPATCTMTNDTATVLDTLRFCYANTISNTYTYFQLGLTAGVPSVLFNSTPAAFLFSITGTKTGRASEFAYMSEQVYDFYARSVNNMATPDQVGLVNYNTQVWFFNAYCITQTGYLPDVDVTMVNWMYATTSTGNTGDDYPSMIRISGKFSAADIANSNKLAVFFNGFEPLADNKTNIVSVYCGGQPSPPHCVKTPNSGIEPVFGYSDILTLRRVIVQIPYDVVPGKSFNIYIPGVPQSTTSSGTSLGVRITFYVATAAELSSHMSYYTMFRTVEIKKYTVLLLKNTQNYPTPITGMADFLSYAGKKVGEYQSLQLTDLSGYDLQTTTASGITLCNKYNFYSLTFNNLLSTDDKDLCAGVNYYSLNNIHRYCYVCPRQGGALADVTFKNIKYPFLHGVDFDDWTIAYSMSDQLINYTSISYTNTLVPSQTPKVLSNLTFYPANYFIGSVDNKLVIYFTLKVELPPSFFIQVSFSTATNWNKIGPNCIFVGYDVTAPASTCTAAGFILTVNSLSTIEYWPRGLYSLTLYVDILSTLAVATESLGLLFQVTNLASATVDQQTTGTSAITISYANSGTQSNPSLLVSNLKILTPILAARTAITFDFEVSARYFSIFDELAIDAPEFQAANPTTQFTCNVLNSDGTLSYLFSQCIITPTTGTSFIRIRPKQEIMTPLVWTVKLVSILTPSALPLTTYFTLAHRRSSDLLASQTGTVPVALATMLAASNSFTSITMTRTNQIPGRITDLTISIVAITGAFSSTSVLFVTFPKNYAQNFGTLNLYCTINAVQVLCQIFSERIIKLSAFSGSIPVGSAITVQIYGIRLPLITTALSISVAFSPTNNGVYESRVVSDTTTPAVPSLLLVVDHFFIESPLSSQRSTMNFTLTFGTTVTTLPGYVAIDFPDRWGYYSQSTPPNYTVDDTAVQLSGTATLVGSRVIVPIGMLVATGSSIYITLFGAWTGSSIPCLPVKPSLSLMLNDMTTVSLPDIYNSDLQTTYRAGSRQLLITVKGSSSHITSLTLNKGTFSQLLTIKPETGRFVTDITFIISDKNVLTTPAVLKATVGSAALEFRIGYPTTAPTSSIALTFTKYEASAEEYYNQPKFIIANVISTPVVIPISDQTIELGGISIPIIIDLSNSPPLTPTLLTFTPVDSVLSVSTLSLNLTAGNPKGVFSITVSKYAAIGTAYFVSLTLSPTGVYTLSSNLITIGVTVSTSIKVSIIDFQLIKPGSQVSRQSAYANFTQQCAAYYGIFLSSRYSSTFSDCAELKREAYLSSGFSAEDPMQLQYIISGVNNLDDIITFENLRSNEQYTMSVCAEGQNGLMTSIESKTFKTPFRQAQMHSLTLFMNKKLRVEQIAKIVCYLTNILAVKANNIYTLDFGEVNCSQSNYSTFFYTNYTTYVFYLRGDSYSEQTDNTRWVLQTFEYALSNANSSASINFQAFLGSVSTGLNYTRAYSTSGINFPSPTLGSNLVLATGINFVTISEITLTSGPGYIFAVVVPRDDIPPSPFQIMNQNNAYGIKVPGSKMFYAGKGAIMISIAGLAPAMRYTFYFVVTNSDFSDMMQTTIPLSVSFSTQNAQITGAAIVSVNYVLMGILFVVSLLMM